VKPIDADSLGRGQFHFLASGSPDRLLVSVLAGVTGGVAHALLIPLLMLSLTKPDPVLAEFARKDVATWGSWEIQHPRFAVAFLVLCTFALVAKAVSQIVLGNLAGEAASELRLFFARRLRMLPIAALETIGSSRIVTAMTTDIGDLLEGASNLPLLMIHGSTIVGALTFIAFLHVKIFLLVLGVIFAGVVTYRLPLMLGQRSFARSREHGDGVQESLRGQVFGAKELKLNAARYQDFMSETMHRHESALVSLLNRGNAIFYLAIQYGNTIGLLAIAAIAFGAANLYDLSLDLLVAIVMALLYIIGPISVLANSVPAMLRGNVALRRLNALLDAMPIEALSEDTTPLPCNEIRVDQVTYSYAQRDAFTIGPVSLTLRRGQVTFLVGGNGSGKSTLAKVLSCHYRPTSGCVRFDGVLLDDHTLQRARQAVSAIYLDFHVFPKLFGHDAAGLDAARRYLDKLGLAEKVTIEDGRFSTIDLSSGQRKRLALLAAYLEDRTLYVFDEWAADQDPEFRRVFYTELLPEFRRRDKIVVVVSHDDRYFDVADQLVRMEHGRVVDIRAGHEHSHHAAAHPLLEAGR